MTKTKRAEKAEEPEGTSLPATAADNAGLNGLGDFTEEQLLGAAEGLDTAAKGDATAEDILDGMGNRKPTLERIEVKHHGVNEFRFPDSSKVDGTEGFVGVALAHAHHNSNFAKPFDEHEEGDQPACWSNDATTVAPEVESPLNEGGCPTCPFNRDAPDRDAREKAFDNKERQELCSNYLSVAVMLPGQDIPLVLRVTASSFKAWAAFVQRLGTRGRFRTYDVLTRFKLQNVKKGGNENSVAQFELADPKQYVLPDTLRKGFALQSPKYRSLLRREAGLGGPSDEAAHAMNEAKAAAKDAEGSTSEAGL